MSFIPKVIELVVKNDLCIGCGLCVYKCPDKALEMHWNEYGFLVPILSGKCNSDKSCLDACPFNIYPSETLKTENELALLFLKDAKFHHPRIGKYNEIYAGYANKYRSSSSSGGIATFILNQLLENGIVDHVISVKESPNSTYHYEYAINNSKDSLLKSSKTKYYPVTLATIFPKINELNGKVAIVGVGCFIKAIRLAQYNEPYLKEKIPFLIGIICGGIKSRFFTDYLSNKLGVLAENVQLPQYRIKDLNSTANDYSYGCYDNFSKTEKTIKMRSVGEMWGTGLFKANACDFCDDVTTELSDISIGDAWMQPYISDGRGTNVLVVRSKIANDIINNGIKTRKLTLNPLTLNQFLISQQGSFNHRHMGLAHRIKQKRKNNLLLPPKRYDNGIVPLEFRIVQNYRLKIRRVSLELWKKYPNSTSFDNKMKQRLKALRLLTHIYHYCKLIKSKL